MKIKDLTGTIVEIKDLDEAIRIIEKKQQDQKNGEQYTIIEIIQKYYWEDLHKKLIELKNKLDNDLKSNI